MGELGEGIVEVGPEGRPGCPWGSPDPGWASIEGLAGGAHEVHAGTLLAKLP